MTIINKGRTKRHGKLPTLLIFAVLSALLLSLAGSARAGILEATPKLRIGVYYNDNLYANDPDEIAPANPGDNDDLASATYINYLVGIMFRYQEQRSTFQISGYAGYSQYLSLDGWVTDQSDDNPADYDFFNANVNLLYRYSTSRVIFEIDDTIRASRDLRDVFGEGTDAIGFWSLYLDNQLGVSFKFKPSGKSRLLVRYTYDMLDFSDPENDQITPPGSDEHRGIVRSEYDFTGKTTGILDAQYAQRTYDDFDDLTVAAYTLWQVMAGIRYRFDGKTYMEALGGYASRTFDDLPDRRLPSPPYASADLLYDLEDYGSPLGRITLVSGLPGTYEFVVSGDYGVSTYGTNLYFDYWIARANFKYYFSPKFYFAANGSYSQSTYDIENNSREWLWDDKDRIDLLTNAGALFHWDIFQKNGEGTLSLEAGYSFRSRDSNIDDLDDYNPIYTGLVGNSFESHDAVVNIFYVQFQMLPTILIGE